MRQTYTNQRSWTRTRQRLVRAWRRRLRRKDVKVGALMAAIVAIGAIMMYSTMPTPTFDPTAYTPLLQTIAKGESNGNYNAYFGDASNTTVRFTDMTVSDVLAWQANHVGLGNVSSAVGRYQMIRPTLLRLIGELEVQPTDRFDEALQDRLAIALIQRRGALDYVNNRLTRDQFAANLAKEWAALPKVLGPNPQESYYAADGINASRLTVDEVYEAVRLLKM